MSIQTLSDHFTLHKYSILGSTNTQARRLADAGAKEGTIIWADRQTAGRGRGGNLWISEPGNLFMSIILRPGTPVSRAGELSLLTGVALAESFETLCDHASCRLEICCKWPNDILVNQAKIAGILIDTATFDGRLTWVVIGMGVNLVSSPRSLGPGATSLKDHGIVLSPVEMIHSLCPRLWAWYRQWCSSSSQDGFQPVRTAWEKRAYRPQGRIIVDNGVSEISGYYQGLNKEGALLLTDAKGVEHTIVTGRLRLETET